MRAIGRALFLDLDGTLIKTRSGDTFAKSKDDWQFNSNILEQISKYVQNDWHIAIVTNQGGIESGKVRLNDFREKIRHIVDRVLVETGCPFSRLTYRFCIGNDKNDFFRKPNPGMGYDIAWSMILDLSQSLMVGDASGKIRKTETIYKDETSPSGWSYADGQSVSEEAVKQSVDFGSVVPTRHIEYRDFADSDKLFAYSCGMPYKDIDDFLKSTPYD